MKGLTRHAAYYEDLVCKGLEAYDTGYHVAAAAHFEDALAVHLFEFPNFELLPWLAVAKALSGDFAEAERAMAEANGAIALLRGELVCVETDIGFHLATRTGRAPAMSEVVQNAVVMRMCGGAYEALYSTDQDTINETLGAFFNQCSFTNLEIPRLKQRLQEQRGDYNK